MGGYIITIAVGVLCIILGICNMMGNISSLHYYHRHRVAEEDKIPFGRLVGLGTILVGTGVTLLGIFLFLADTFSQPIFMAIGTAIMIVGLIAGLALSFYAMKKYNHGIF